MPVTLGAITLDDATTAFKEKLEEVGGRDERRITVSGLVTGFSAVPAIESRLDEILDAASLSDYTAELSLRPGRWLLVRRQSYRREVRADDLVGAFTLELGARNAFEESVDVTSLNWPIATSGATLNAASAGTLYARPVITLVASGTLIDPAFSDGERTLSFSGTVADAESLVIDALAGIVTLEGDDVTPYTAGEFPRIPPEGVTLTYTDDAASSHTATATVAFRDRWW
jgi:hypothetical protein